MLQVTNLVALRLSSIYAFWMRSGRCQHNDLFLLDILFYYFSHFDIIDDVSQHDMHLRFPYVLNLVGDAYIYFYLCCARCRDTNHVCLLALKWLLHFLAVTQFIYICLLWNNFCISVKDIFSSASVLINDHTILARVC